MTGTGWKRFCLLVVTVAWSFTISSCGSTQQVHLFGRVVDPPFKVGGTRLETTAGRPFSIASSGGTALTLVFFGYSKCPDICPVVLAALTAGLAKLTTAEQAEVTTVFVTSDPVRDTPETLRRYLDRFSTSIVGLRGSLAATAKLGKTIGIYVDQGEALPGGGYDPSAHGAYLVGIDRSHQAPVFWGSDTAPSEYAHDIRFLLTEHPEHLRAPEVAPTTVSP